MERKKIGYFLLFFSFLWIQNSLTTVLSSRGIGLPVGVTGIQYQGMAGISIPWADLQSVQSINPASLHQIQRTIIAVPFNSEWKKYNEQEESESLTFGNFKGFAFALPIGKGMGFAMHLTPRTQLDYCLGFSNTLDGETYHKEVQTLGGLNSFDFSFFVNPASFLGVGFSTHYLFGKWTEQWKIMYHGTNFTTTENSLSTRNWGWAWTSGVMIYPVRSMALGLVFRPHATSHTETQLYSSALDTQTVVHSGSIRVPGLLGMGLKISVKKRLSIAGEYVQEDWQDLQINHQPVTNMASVHRVALGCEFHSSDDPTASFFQRIPFRVGLSYATFYTLDPKGHTIPEFWFTTGWSLPFVSAGSQMDFSLGIGQIGQKVSNGFEERIFRLGCAVVISERWFVRK